MEFQFHEAKSSMSEIDSLGPAVELQFEIKFLGMNLDKPKVGIF